MNSKRLLHKVVKSALNGERDANGWIYVDAPKATDKQISLAILEAVELGVAKGCRVDHFESEYPEWKLVGSTGKSRYYLWNNSPIRKTFAMAGIACCATLGFVAWLIPVVIKLERK
jgi:hypothetical protein